MHEDNLILSANAFMQDQVRRALSGVHQNRKSEILMYKSTEDLLNSLLTSYCDQFEPTLNWLSSINDSGVQFWEENCPSEILYTPIQENYVKNKFLENSGKPYELVMEEFAVMGWYLSQLSQPVRAEVGIPGFGMSQDVFVDTHFGYDFTPIMHGILRFLMGSIQDLRTIYDGETGRNLKKTTFNDFFVDWLQVHFRFHLREHRTRNPLPPPSPASRGGKDDEGPGGFGTGLGPI